MTTTVQSNILSILPDEKYYHCGLLILRYLFKYFYPSLTCFQTSVTNRLKTVTIKECDNDYSKVAALYESAALSLDEVSFTDDIYTNLFQIFRTHPSALVLDRIKTQELYKMRNTVPSRKLSNSSNRRVCQSSTVV